MTSRQTITEIKKTVQMLSEEDDRVKSKLIICLRGKIIFQENKKIF
jgi:hypothetical protein